MTITNPIEFEEAVTTTLNDFAKLRAFCIEDGKSLEQTVRIWKAIADMWVDEEENKTGKFIRAI